MKRHTFYIDDSTGKAQALLEFLRTLDFVIEEGKKYTLTNEHLEILEERRNNRIDGTSHTYTWDEVKKSLGKKNDG